MARKASGRSAGPIGPTDPKGRGGAEARVGAADASGTSGAGADAEARGAADGDAPGGGRGNAGAPMGEREVHELLFSLITTLLAERAMRSGTMTQAPARATDNARLWEIFRALENTREPWPADPRFLARQDRLLRALIGGEARVSGVCADGVTSADSPEVLVSPLDPAGCLRMWRGDITRIAVDAVVTAASPQLLGCWVPGHRCVDNAVHTFAGVQLRLACADLMRRRGQLEAGRRADALDPRGRPARSPAELGFLEPEGVATITGGFNLPARHVIHTVAPFVGDAGAGAPDGGQARQRPSLRECNLLASCYRNCLDFASTAGDRSIAFCCLGTGTYGFPCELGAYIAVRTALTWLSRRPSDEVASMRIVFVTFTDEDERAYRRELLLEDAPSPEAADGRGTSVEPAGDAGTAEVPDAGATDGSGSPDASPDASELPAPRSAASDGDAGAAPADEERSGR
ncbi:MAG: macro domain-containing protein [Coriobacteriales bacterium]